MMRFLPVLLAGAALCAGPPAKKKDLTPEDRRGWETYLGLPADCSRDSRDDLAWINFYQWSPQKYVVEVACNFGAYQGTQVFYWFDEASGKARLLEFDNFQDDGEKIRKERRSELLGITEWKPKLKRLAITGKFRGIGDCGTYQVYDFVDGNPRLIDARVKKNCDGKPIRSWSALPRLR